MNICFCDGGLSNRLNALIFCLILKQRYSHQWKFSWPINNWCGAPFSSLFSTDLEVDNTSLEEHKKTLKNFTFLLHENQIGFPAEQLLFNAQIATYADYKNILDNYPNVFYTHNLLPPFVPISDASLALPQITINDSIRRKAESFCEENTINDSTLGLHIRKTDFGDIVNDEELFRLVENSPQRFFVCSDDAAVNERFSRLPNCHVFPKNHFPTKRVKDADWQAWITDTEGRQFPFNIDRSEEATIEGLIDLLILSRTTLVRTSHSTFFNMALLFKSTGFF